MVDKLAGVMVVPMEAKSVAWSGLCLVGVTAGWSALHWVDMLGI